MSYESDGSQMSDIPEEHSLGYGHNEYMRRYVLNMRVMTWSKDSQGLFDYETRQCTKQKITTDKSMRLIRTTQTNCKLHEPDEELSAKYGKRYQVLCNIKKVRNHYVVEPAELEHIATLNAEEKKKFMAKDVDNFYAETGEQLQDPCDTFEKIYLIVRNIKNRNLPQ